MSKGNPKTCGRPQLLGCPAAPKPELILCTARRSGIRNSYAFVGLNEAFRSQAAFGLHIDEKLRKIRRTARSVIDLSPILGFTTRIMARLSGRGRSTRHHCAPALPTRYFLLVELRKLVLLDLVAEA